jgi:hypothetical protein
MNPLFGVRPPSGSIASLAVSTFVSTCLCQFVRSHLLLRVIPPQPRAMLLLFPRRCRPPSHSSINSRSASPNVSTGTFPVIVRYDDMLESVVMFLISCCVAALVIYLVIWVLGDVIGLALPPKVIQILWVIFALIVILMLVQLLLPHIGGLRLH